MKKFWMIWRPGSSGFIYQHKSLDSAREEAKRLARQNPENYFVVLEAISYCRKIDVEWNDLLMPCPF